MSEVPLDFADTRIGIIFPDSFIYGIYNLGQNSWDKSQNCTISVFDSVPPLPPFQCWLNQTPFDHPNIELGGKGDEKVLNVCFHLDILGNMTKTQKFASVPIYFDQDCSMSSVGSKTDSLIEIPKLSVIVAK